jgi:hypothetical protein
VVEELEENFHLRAVLRDSIPAYSIVPEGTWLSLRGQNSQYNTEIKQIARHETFKNSVSEWILTKQEP